VFTGPAISSFGNSLVPVALAFAVLRDTGSATDLGYVLGSEEVAVLFLYLLGGVVADRLPRRSVMIAADVVRCTGEVTLGLLFVLGHPSIPGICALTAVQGVAGGVFAPAALGLIPAVADNENLQQANMLQSMASNVTSVVAPAIGGILVVTVGGGWAILGDGVTFAVNAVILTALRLDLPSKKRPTTVIADLKQGWGAFTSRSWYWHVVLSVAGFNLFAGVYVTLGPVIARRYYGGAGAWATIATVGALGAVLGGAGLMRIRPRHPLRTGIQLSMLWPLIPVALALRLPLPVVCLAASVGFLGVLAFNDLLHTVIHKMIPEDVLSRVVAYDYFFGDLALPIGILLAGPTANALGARGTLAGAGVLVLVVLMATMLVPSVRNFTVDTAAPGPADLPGQTP
jgi:MFS family permease